MFVDAPDDGGEGRDFFFKEGRVIPVYCYYPGERRGYVVRCESGSACCCIPNVEGQCRVLLAVRGPEVERLEKAVRRLYEDLGVLESVPEGFWPNLGVFTASRRFRVHMVQELYLVAQQKLELQQELKHS